MSLARLRYEARVIGPANLLIPLAVIPIYLGFSIIAGVAVLRGDGPTSFAHFQAMRGLMGLLENGLPLAGGLVAAATLGSDPLLEVHLSLPWAYRWTGALRLALSGLWVLLLTALAGSLIAATGFWPSALIAPLPRGQLIWLSPLLVFVSLGAFSAIALRSRTAASAMVGLLWVAQFLFKSLFEQSVVLQRVYLFLTEEYGVPGYWLANRLTLVAIGCALFCVTLWLLGRNETLLGAES